MSGSRDNTIVYVAAIIALVAIGAGVVYSRPDQAGQLLPLIGMIVLGLLAVIRGERGVEVAEKAVEVAEEGKAQTGHVSAQMNGQLAELKALIRAAAFAEGQAQGRADQKTEGGSAPIVPAAGLPPVVTETVVIDAGTVNVTPKKDA